MTDLIELLKNKVTAAVLDGETGYLPEKIQALASFYPVLLSILKAHPDLIGALQNQLNPRFSDLFRTGTDLKLQFLSQVSGDAPLNETENVLSKAIAPTLGLLSDEAGSSHPQDIVKLIQSQIGSISSKVPVWAASILSAFGIGSVAAAATTATPKVVAQPTLSSTPLQKEEKKSGFLLPLIALLVLLGLIAFLYKSCSTKKDVDAGAGAVSSQSADLKASSLQLVTDQAGQLTHCQISSGDAGFLEKLKTDIKSLFSQANDCTVETNAELAKEFVDQDAIPGVLQLLKGVPGINLNWTGNQLTVQAPDQAAAEALVGKIQPLLKNATVSVAAPLDESSAVSTSISSAEKALSELNAEQTTAQELADALNLQIINFATGSNAIPDANKAVLNKAADVLKNAKSVQLVVGGHTDATGNPDANKTLSQKRAQAVVDYFVQQGVDAAQLKAVGFGQEKPVAENETPEGRFKNRRIAFEVLNTETGSVSTVDANGVQQQ